MAASAVENDAECPKAAGELQVQSMPPKKLEALSREIHAAYTSELGETESINPPAGNDGIGIPSNISRGSRTKFQSIRTLWNQDTSNLETNTSTRSLSSSMKLDVIQAWDELIAAMIEQNVFLDYVSSSEDAFREIAEKQTSLPGSADNEQEELAATSWFRHQWNLANLLTHTVKNHHRDNSTECRFVTLLEVALSYQSAVTSKDGDSKVVYQWKPSNNVQRFWVRLQQPIDSNMTPFEFRRKAYGILVSLSWVPSSKGLLQACSIPDNRPLQLSSEAPLEARRVLGKIPGRPLPRNDSVYQVLDRLKDETNVSVVITASKFNKVSSLGIGKSTVAALVAVHPLILRCFQVLWLNMDYKKQPVASILHEESNQKQEKLNYVTYIEYLDNLCQQLGCDATDKDGESSPGGLKRPRWPEAHSLKRIEEPAIRHRREENLMRRAQKMMTNVLEKSGRNILLVLDDITGINELAWFHFTEKQSILATSPSPIHGVDFSVDLDPWGDDESIELFLLEADCSPNQTLASATELQQIVRQSHFHPIIVRTAARLFKLKRVTAGVVQALEEANEEFSPGISRVLSTAKLSATPVHGTSSPGQLLKAVSVRSLATSDHSGPGRASRSIVPRSLKKLLDSTLSPMMKKLQQPSILFKLCLASFAAVFSEFQPVPLTAVLLLWEQLFVMEPDAIDECGGSPTAVDIKKRVWFITEGLTHMGLLSFTEDASGEACVAIHHEMYVKYALDSVVEMGLGERAKDILMQWHKAFVAAYLTRKFEGDNCDSCHEYALEKLSTHMLCCDLHVKVVALLSNGRLYQERISAFGRDRATSLHVKDCVLLMQHIRRDPTIPKDQREEITSEHFQKIAALLTENVNTSQETSALELAKDLYAIGFGLAENGKYSQSLDLYTQAHGLCPKSDSFAATILYGLGSVNLSLNEPAKAIKSFMGAIACMTIMGEDGDVAGKARHPFYHEVSRLQGEASLAQCNYKMSLTQFEETAEQMTDDDSFESEIEYGILMNRKGRLHQVMGDLKMAASELEKCIKWKGEIGERSRDLAAAHSTLADVYTAMDLPTDGRQHIDMALKTIQEVDSEWPKLKYDDEGQETDIEVPLLAAKLRTLRPDMPHNWADFEMIRKQILKSPVLYMDQSGYDLRCIARAYTAAEEHETAVSIIEDALKLLSDRPESLERALCLLDLGNSFMDQGEAYDNESKAKVMFELALKLFALALKIQRPKLGECQQVLETLDAIGNLHVHLQEHETAITIYSEALALARKLRNEADKIAGILFFLGECHEALGNHDGALGQYDECLAGLRVDRMGDDLDLARPLQRLGAISLLLGSFEKAKDFYDEILKIREANFAPDDVLLAETLDVLGFVEIKLLNYESANSYLRKALDIRMQHDDDKRSIGDTLYQIGNAYRMQADFTNALSNLEQSLSTLEGIVEENSPLLATVMLGIGETYFGLGQMIDASSYCQRALIIRGKLLGRDHRKTANASRSLGMVNFCLNKTNDAAYLLQEYVRIMDGQSKHGSALDYMAVLVMLSDIQMANDREKLAKKILTTADDFCRLGEGKYACKGGSVGEKLREMIQRRLAMASPSPSQSLEEGGEGPVMKHDSGEVNVFQSIPLSDD